MVPFAALAAGRASDTGISRAPNPNQQSNTVDELPAPSHWFFVHGTSTGILQVADEEGDPAGLADLDALITGEVSLGFAGMQAVGANTSSVTVIPGNFTAEFTVIANATAAKAELPILFLYATWNVEVGCEQLASCSCIAGLGIVAASIAPDWARQWGLYR